MFHLPTVYLYIHLPISLSTCLSACLFLWLFVLLPVCLSVCLSVYDLLLAGWLTGWVVPLYLYLYLHFCLLVTILHVHLPIPVFPSYSQRKPAPIWPKTSLQSDPLTVDLKELEDFYMTNPISRASPTMARCVTATKTDKGKNTYWAKPHSNHIIVECM